MTTSNYSAEYGRAAGGVVNAVTKSGTNQLMGSGFYFIRDNKWGASNPFQTQTILQNGVSTVVQLKPDDRRQQFGGTLGGPIQKDRVFFFFSYDQQARKFPGVAAPSNPAAFFAGFSAAELATFAQRGISPAQAADGLSFLQGLTGVVDRTGDQTLILPKIDWKVNNNHSLAVTYNRLRWDSPAGVQTAAVVNRGVESWGNDSVHGDWATARFSSVLGSRMTNEVKFQWGRDFEFQSSQDPLPGEPVSHTGRTPAVDITGASGISFGKPNFLERRSYPDERRIDVGDVVTLVGRLASGEVWRQRQPRLRHPGQPVPGRRRLRLRQPRRLHQRLRSQRQERGGAVALLHQLQPGCRPDGVFIPHLRLRRVRPGHVARHLAHDAQPGPALRLREDAGPADSERLAAGHLGVPEGPEQLRTSTRRRLRCERDR